MSQANTVHFGVMRFRERIVEHLNAVKRLHGGDGDPNDPCFREAMGLAEAYELTLAILDREVPESNPTIRDL